MTGLVTLGETMGALSTSGSGPLSLHQQLSLSIAGAESTVAIGVARLGQRSRWIGRVGDDEVGRLVVKTLAAERVDVSSVVEDPAAPTGLMIKEHRVGDVVRVSYHRRGSAGAALSVADLPEDEIAAAGVLHITGVTPALSASAADAVRRALDIAREAGVPVSLDVNYRSRLWSREAAADTLAPLAAAASTVFGSIEELALVTGEPAEIGDSAAKLLDAGVKTVVVKLGAQGAAVYDSTGRSSAEAVRVPVVDLIGAGDAFVAGYLSAMLTGADVSASLASGCAVAAFSVGTSGDWEGLPRPDELALLSSDPTVR